MRTTVRTADGFPDWEIVAAGERWFNQYDYHSVTELAFYIDNVEWRLAVNDRDRRVIGAAWMDDTGARNVWGVLSRIPGLVRVYCGPETFGHTDYYVARETSGVAY